MKTIIKTAIIGAAIAGASLSATASADTLVVNVAGAQSFFDFGEAGNEVRTFNIGANSRITGVAYNVSITAFSPSWLSEATLAFTGSDTLGDGVFLSPGFADDNAGTGIYADSANLTDLGLDFTVGADGILRLEFFEGFDDGSISPDAIWNSGTITFTYDAVAGAVPEPATWAMMIGGFGMVGGVMRRRQKTSVRFA